MRFLTLAISILLSSTTIGAQNMQFVDWDTDGDGIIERQEFAKKFVTDVFDNWKKQTETGIIQDEYFSRSYLGLDSDGDNRLSDQEWMVGYNYFYDDYLPSDDIMVYDTDNDGYIEYAEYYDALYDTHYFTGIDVDRDGYLTEYELAYYVFDEWDFDDSYTLSRSEYNAFDWYYLDI